MVLMSLGGLIAGVPFGAAVLVGEYLLRRRLRVAMGMVCAIAAAVAASWAMVEVEFSRQEVLPAFTHEAVAVALAGGMLLASSRPMKPNQAL